MPPVTRRTTAENPNGLTPTKNKRKKTLTTQSLPVLYRPTKLTDYYGQDKAVSTLLGSLARGRLSPSLMIVGQSGTGKTTLARILSRIVNCSHLSEEFEPCGECHNCKLSIDEHPDVHEINFAEKRGIDDVRAVLQQSRNMPVFGNKRIFILDEAHAMTPQAQQAMLKPAEEPSEHTLWIVCTTDPQKFASTLSNRFTKVKLEPIEPELIAKRLRIIAKREGFDTREHPDLKSAILKISEYSNGMLRNAIEMLDSAINIKSNGKDLTDDKVIQRYVMGDDANLEEAAANLLAAIIDKDIEASIKVVRSTGADAVRALLGKTRWLVDHLIETKVGYPKFTPHSARCFTPMKKKWNVELLAKIQYCLCIAEDRMNTLNIDDRVVFEGYLAGTLPNFATPVTKP